MQSTGSIRCLLVTPEKTFLEKDGSLVVVPAFDGEIAVLPGHAPTVARLAPGELRLTAGNEKLRYFIDGGFAQVLGNVVTVLTPRVREIADLDIAKLETNLVELTAESSSSAQGQLARTERMNLVRSALRVARKGESRSH